MKRVTASSALALFSVILTSCTHNSTPPNTHTISVMANETVTAEPDLAILHIGFDTPPEDLKSAYADGARRSNAIVAAVEHAGIPEEAIRSMCQYIDRDWSKEHKFRLAQQWSVKVTPRRAAEILDIAIAAGASSSGQIEWTVKDEKAIENQALDRASARARENATVLANGMGAHLGPLVNVSNQVAPTQAPLWMNAMQQAGALARSAPPLAIEPHQVSRNATVYAVFAIE